MRTLTKSIAAAVAATIATAPGATIATAPVVAEDATAAIDAGSTAEALRAGFTDPPAEARPRTWWHWMTGNVTADGITKDLEWMERIGIAGFQYFDEAAAHAPVVPEPVIFLGPAWKDALRHAITTADELGLEAGFASSAGWSISGGPWVPVEDSQKKLVWTESTVEGGSSWRGQLAEPPAVAGPFGNLEADRSIAAILGTSPADAPPMYQDIAVFAYPVEPDPAATPAAILDASGEMVDADVLLDDDLTSGLELARSGPMALTLVYDEPTLVRSARLAAPGQKSGLAPAGITARLEASDDGEAWRAVADIPVVESTSTVSFAPTTATRFRVTLSPQMAMGAIMPDPAPGADLGFLAEAMMAGMSAPVHVTDLRLSSEPRVNEFEQKAGFSIPHDYYALGQGPDDGAGVAPEEVIDLTDRLQSDGTLEWEVPEGSWRIVRLGWSPTGAVNSPAIAEATGLEVDKLDAEAVARYTEHYLGEFRDAVGDDLFGDRGLRVLLTDSIEAGPSNWTPRMLDQFRQLRGYDPQPFLPTLTGAIVGSRAESDGFLYDYRRTLADLVASEHYGTIARVAHEHGLTVYGEAFETGRPSLGDDLAMRSHADVPMAAMWAHKPGANPAPTYVADLKGASSVAHLYGRNVVAAESMTSMLQPYASAPSDLRHVIDLEFVNGVNLPVIQASAHQPTDAVPGISLSIHGQYFNRHETWAEMAAPWIDYMARSAFLLQQGQNHADVAYFYGEEAPLTGLHMWEPADDVPTRYAYDYLNADALMDRLSVEDGVVVAEGGARYEAIYLGGSSERMTVATLGKLASLVEAGALVIGLAPNDSPSAADDPAEFERLVGELWSGDATTSYGKGLVVASSDVEAALEAQGIRPDFEFSAVQDGADIPFVHRQLADGDIYYLVNRLGRPEELEARFRVAGKAPQVWRADSGTIEPVSYAVGDGATTVPLRLEAGESLFVVFVDDAIDERLEVEPTVMIDAVEVAGPWDVSFQEDRGAPAGITLETLGSLTEHDDPGVKYFSGVATYSTEFATPDSYVEGDPLWIDLGEIGDLAELRVNDEPVGTTWHAPWRLDISDAVRPGQNQLEVRVANLWVNRLVGDAALPEEERITWTSDPTYTAGAPLRPSGLIGPVRVLAAE